ncbi:MAG TPA: molybdenum cofactor guanylyltransferase MobA [Nevskiaceae bacterium]|nr:molybdenum cofactor guanylyltransferase MobA [Nevskiaceae bacterium]
MAAAPFSDDFHGTHARDACTGLVLAGGRGTRFGGADKGLVEFRGRPLAQHALDLLRPQVRSCLVSANRNRESYERFGAPVLADEHSGFPGPLAGMATGLAHCPTRWLLCVPCDMPQLPAALAESLLRSALLKHRPAAYAVFDGDPAYVCALLHRDLLDPLRAFLAGGQRAVRAWLAACNACAVDFPDAVGAVNLNSALDLREALG